jgi:hypothetical protein
MQELEVGVEAELTEVQVSEPAEDAAGVPTEAWLEDPYLPRYEAGLRTLLGAVEGMIEHDGGDGRPAPSGETGQ